MEQNIGVNPYGLERLAAERRAEFMREAGRCAGTGGRLSLTVAGALRGVADWLDGGDGRSGDPAVSRRLSTASSPPRSS